MLKHARCKYLKHSPPLFHPLLFCHGILQSISQDTRDLANSTHILVLVVLLVILVLVALFLVSLVVEIVFFWRGAVAVGVVGLVHAWMGLVLRLLFPLHSALGQLLHHLDELLPVVFEQIVRNR